MQPATQPMELWRQDESLRDLASRLEPRPADLQVISFDFFDTLVCRVCAEPSELFIEVGRRLTRDRQLLLPLTPDEFRNARIAADERARKKAIEAGTIGEVKLADIYAELKTVVRSPAAARDIEFEIERAFCYVNPAMASFVQHVRALGYRTAVVSDTYFTAAELQRILRENGLDPAAFDACLVSCERSAAKWNGALYQDLFRQLNLHPSEVLHIGDNIHADIASASRLRVEAVHYYRTNPQLDTIFNGERRLHGPDTTPAAALNSLRALTARRARDKQDAFRDGALVFGPVLTRYADWCVAQFANAGVTTVLALMREGEVLGELLQRAADASGVSLNVVPCFASRISTARAAMTEVTPERALELLEGCGGLTPQAVLDILGIGAEAEQLLPPAARAKPLGSHDEVRGLIKLLFSLPMLRQLIESKRAQSHELANEYLSSLTGTATAIGMVDLGWSGSIQRNIARILRRNRPEIRTIGCYLACTKRAGRLAIEGDVAHGFLDANWDRTTILPEIAITAMVGSTDGYARNATGKVQPVLGAFEIQPAEREIKDRLRAGIMEFQTAWLTLRRSKGAGAFSPEMLADLDDHSAAIFYRLLEFPTKPEADRLGVLTHDENYFGQHLSAPLCDDKSPERLRHGGLAAIYQNARCYWPQGVAARSNPRLVSALRSGWADPVGLGRLGAWNGVEQTDPGISNDELASLLKLLEGFAPEQIIFVGNPTQRLQELLAQITTVAPANKGISPDATRVLILNDRPVKSADAAAPTPLSGCQVVTGDPGDVRTLRAVRALLRPGSNAALVFSADLAASRMQPILFGLTPFLGAQGLVLSACGRFDRHSLGEELPQAEAVNGWVRTHAHELGFGLWSGNIQTRNLLSDWLVFRREPTAVVWNKQWMLTADEFALATAPAA